MERVIKNYFFNTAIEEWNYEDFNKYMKLLGYEKEEDVYRIYRKILKDFAEDNINDNDRTNDSGRIYIELLRRSGKYVYNVSCNISIIFIFSMFENERFGNKYTSFI